jgi:excisionase family DNA binding protein
LDKSESCKNVKEIILMRLLNIQEASEQLRIPKSTLYKYVHRRIVPFTKLNGRLFFALDALEDWVMKSSYTPKAG